MTIVNHFTKLSDPAHDSSLKRSTIELLPCSEYSVSYTPESHVIGFAFDPQSGVHSMGTDHRQDFYRQANSFAFTPKGCDVFSESAGGGEYLTFNVVPELLSSIDTDQPINKLVVGSSVRVARELRMRIVAGQLIEQLLIEKIIEDLVQLLTTTRKTVVFLFRPYQLKRLDEFIDAHIDQSLSVLMMARVVNMSAGHFSRVFKASIGVSPFDYIIQRRLSYARHCIRCTRDDLSDVALKSGFSSHAHMSMMLKKYFGCPPGQLRMK